MQRKRPRLSLMLFCVALVALTIFNLSIVNTGSEAIASSQPCLFLWEECSWYGLGDGRVWWCIGQNYWIEPICLGCPWYDLGDCDNGGGGDDGGGPPGPVQ